MNRKSSIFNKKQNGFGILEIVLAVAIVSGSLYALASVFILSGRTVELSRERLTASFLMEEGLEVLRFLRDSSWDGNIGTLAAGTDYYLSFNETTSTWSIQTAATTQIDGVFDRSFRVENVLRDGGDNIAASGTADPETKKIIMKVSWFSRNQSQVSTLEAYLMDIFDN